MHHAASQDMAGDTVLVHTGTYDELVTVRGTGAADAPVTFRTAPGAVVWLTGSDRLRSTAFLIKEKNHVNLDGFRFRDFLSEESSHKSVVVINGGSHNTVRRGFYDGRVLSGYMNVFLGMNDSPDALVENCVMILGMGEGMSIHTCPRSVTVTHNLFCAVIPAKGGSAFMRTRQLRNLKWNGQRVAPDPPGNSTARLPRLHRRARQPARESRRWKALRAGCGSVRW